MRDGVSPSRTVLPRGSWPTILHCLIERFPQVAAAEWLRRVALGEVVDTEGVAITATRPHEPGLTVFYYRTIMTEPRIPFEECLLFQDEHLVVVDKPHFLPVMPAGRFLHETLLVRLKRKLANDSLVPIHRIDRGTAGVVLFCANLTSRGAYQALFRERTVEKTYEAIAPYNEALKLPMLYESRLVPDEHFTRMREVEGEPNAQTRIELIERLDGDRADAVAAPGAIAHYRLSPTTGRKHQLRVQCAALSIPILNDPIYPVLLAEHAAGSPDEYSKPLQLLARSVSFQDPMTGEQRSFSSNRELQCASTPL